MDNAKLGGVRVLMPTNQISRLMLALAALAAFSIAAAGAGTLAPGDSQLDSGEYYDQFSFTGNAGDQVQLELSSDAFDPYLMVVDATGTVLFEEDDSKGAGNGVNVVYTLPAGGTYAVVVTSFQPGETGGYRLVISAVGQQPAAPVAPPATGAAGGTVSGHVVDTAGQPIAGARVVLSPALTTGQVDLVTDANGYYQASSLPDVPYNIRAWQFVDYFGERICMRLALEQPSDYDTFTATNGVVRNFHVQLDGQIPDMLTAFDGHFGGAINFVLWGDYYPEGPRGQVEFSFTPTGPLIDGSAGEPFTRTITAQDTLITGIPVGPYRLSATFIDTDGSRQALPLALGWNGPGQESLDINWTGDADCDLSSGFDWLDIGGFYAQ